MRGTSALRGVSAAAAPTATVTTAAAIASAGASEERIHAHATTRPARLNETFVGCRRPKVGAVDRCYLAYLGGKARAKRDEGFMGDELEGEKNEFRATDL